MGGGKRKRKWGSERDGRRVLEEAGSDEDLSITHVRFRKYLRKKYITVSCVILRKTQAPLALVFGGGGVYADLSAEIGGAVYRKGVSAQLSGSSREFGFFTRTPPLKRVSLGLVVQWESHGASASLRAEGNSQYDMNLMMG